MNISLASHISPPLPSRVLALIQYLPLNPVSHHISTHQMKLLLLLNNDFPLILLLLIIIKCSISPLPSRCISSSSSALLVLCTQQVVVVVVVVVEEEEIVEVVLVAELTLSCADN